MIPMDPLWLDPPPSSMWLFFPVPVFLILARCCRLPDVGARKVRLTAVGSGFWCPRVFAVREAVFRLTAVGVAFHVPPYFRLTVVVIVPLRPVRLEFLPPL